MKHATKVAACLKNSGFDSQYFAKKASTADGVSVGTASALPGSTKRGCISLQERNNER